MRKSCLMVSKKSITLYPINITAIKKNYLFHWPNQYGDLSFSALLCQAKCAYPIDIVTERVKGTIKPEQSILLEVPEFDEPLLHVRRLQSPVPRFVRLDHEHDKPVLLTHGYFYSSNGHKLPDVDRENEIIPQESGLFPFAEDLSYATARRKNSDVRPSIDQFLSKQSGKMQR